jgi:hypothetical protein
MRKFLLLLLSLCFVFSLFTGCSSSDQPKKDKDKKPSTQTGQNPSDKNNEKDELNNIVRFSEGLEFTKMPNGAYRVTGMGTCTDTDVVIPDTYNGASVIGIDNKVFMNNASITSVVIPDGVLAIDNSSFDDCVSLKKVVIPASVVEIGNAAFYGCTNLETVTLSEGVKSLGKWVFDRCKSLTSISIPASVTSIGVSVFRGCDSLTEITVDSGNSVYHSAGNCLIETASGALITGCKTSVIPTDGSVTRIEKNAFESCSGLTNITIPASVNYIGSDAFMYCSSLESVVFENPNGWVVDYIKVNVSSPETAKDYLRGKYSEFVWTREG